MIRGYHGTFLTCIEGIRREGLKPRRAGDDVCFTVCDEDMHEKRMLASSDDLSAFELARMVGDGTVIEVDLGTYAPEDVDFFEDEGDGGSSWEARVRDVVPPDLCIVHLPA